MPKLVSKNSKRKYGLGAPAYTPRFHSEPKGEANIPMWQPDGNIKYITKGDFEWLVKNGKIDMPMPEGVKSPEKEEDQKSSA